MAKQRVRAIYENGALRPLEPLDLTEGQIVSLTIYVGGVPGEDEEDDEDENDYFPLAADDGDPNITWEEVHEALKSIPGSLADQIIRDREDRC